MNELAGLVLTQPSDDGVRMLTLNGAEKKNALSIQLRDEMSDALDLESEALATSSRAGLRRWSLRRHHDGGENAQRDSGRGRTPSVVAETTGHRAAEVDSDDRHLEPSMGLVPRWAGRRP